MNAAKIQRLCAWSGVANMSIYFIGMMIAGFLPVPSPALTAAQVAAMFHDNNTAILIGAVLMLASGCFLVPLIALISAFLKRIEGPMPIMAYGQIVAGVLGILFFYLPAVLFFVMAFRLERSADLLYLFYDFAWMFMIIAWPSFVFQNGAIALGILSDRKATPTFPRWLAYFQLWTAFLYCGSFIGPFFKTGPFAWNGLFAFWIPALVFFLWNFVMAFELIKAINRLERETLAPSGAVRARPEALPET